MELEDGVKEEGENRKRGIYVKEQKRQMNSKESQEERVYGEGKRGRMKKEGGKMERPTYLLPSTFYLPLPYRCISVRHALM